MALKKVLLDIEAADGLSQKVSPQRLPPGKAAAAINLVKNKLGQLEKRLGFAPLANTYIQHPDGLNIVPNTGVALGDWKGNLLAIQRGPSTNIINTAPFVTALSTYDIDGGNWQYKGAVPECNLVSDTTMASAAGIIFSPTEVLMNGYLVQMWIANANTPAAVAGTVYWQIVDAKTGNVITPPQILDSVNTSIIKVELINTGTTIIAVYADGGSTLWGNYATIAAPSAFAWHNIVSAGGINLITNATLGNNFEAVEVTGDVNHWMLAYSVAVAGPNYTVRVAKMNNTLGSVATVDMSTTANKACSFGLRADTTDNIAVAWTRLATGTIGAPTAAFTLNVGNANYSAMTLNGTLNVYTGGNTVVNAVTYYEFPPNYIVIGKTKPSAVATWTVSWSPYNGRTCFNTGGLNGIPSLLPYNNSRIISVMFTNSAGTINLSLSSTSGPSSVTTLQTYGCHIMSRYLEVNNILYCLAYFPSDTQGGYVLLAADFSFFPNDTSSGFAYAHRPIANIQTRTSLLPVNPASTVGWVFNPTPGNIVNSGDQYATCYCCYVATEQQNKTTLCGAAIQFLPQSGYPMAKWGDLTCVGGAMPLCFDGSTTTEQNFLQAPDGNNRVVQSGVLVSGSVFSGLFATPTINASGLPFTNSTDAYNYIVTYEQFDGQGNYHQSARSVPITITGANVNTWTGAVLPNAANVQLTIPTCGVTMRTGVVDSITSPLSSTLPSSPVNIGIYRTKQNGSVYYRVTDKLLDGNQQVTSGSAAGALTYSANVTLSGSSFVTFTDNLSDAALADGTHPLLYGDGTNGAPGALDDFCPPATPILVRHKERLWVSRGNQILYTKQRGQAVGPGYNEQVNVEFIGNDDPLTGAESLDDKFIVLKASQLYYIAGDGPADDGSGNAFSQPQPIPTDSGCLDPRGVKTTPEGVYFMSEAGLRVLTRALAVEYAGGPAENEFGTYPILADTVIYPTNNKIMFFITADDSQTPAVGEWVTRDYVLDAWTTGQLNSGLTNTPIAAATALANRIISSGTNNTQLENVLYFMTKDGRVWQERDPLNLTGPVFPYWDDGIYITTTWTTPPFRPAGDMGRFRLWDVITQINSQSAHDITVAVYKDYALTTLGPNTPSSYSWDWVTQILPQLATTSLTHLRNYYGALVEGASVTIIDSAPSPPVVGNTGKGAIMLGLTCAIGVDGKNWKPGTGVTQ